MKRQAKVLVGDIHAGRDICSTHRRGLFRLCTGSFAFLLKGRRLRSGSKCCAVQWCGAQSIAVSRCRRSLFDEIAFAVILLCQNWQSSRVGTRSGATATSIVQSSVWKNHGTAGRVEGDDRLVPDPLACCKRRAAGITGAPDHSPVPFVAGSTCERYPPRKERNQGRKLSPFLDEHRHILRRTTNNCRCHSS